MKASKPKRKPARKPTLKGWGFYCHCGSIHYLYQPGRRG